MALLELRNISKSFGEVKTIRGVSLSVERGTIATIIGPNGAGKTTLFNLISGFLSQDSGSIFYKGRLIDGMTPSERAALGIGRLWQDGRLFRNMSVLDNLLVARRGQPGESILNCLLRRKEVSAWEKANFEAAQDVLKTIKLQHKIFSPALDLSHGQQKLLALGRLLMYGADLLLLDEPTASVDPVMLDELLEIIKNLGGSNRTVLMIEHNAPKAMGISDQVCVLSRGQIKLAGDPATVTSDPRLKEVYWGV